MTFTPNLTGTSETVLMAEWYFGDGGYEYRTDLNPVTHTYADAGNYDVRLTVTYGDGCRETYQVQADPYVVVPWAPLMENTRFLATSKITFFVSLWDAINYPSEYLTPNWAPTLVGPPIYHNNWGNNIIRIVTELTACNGFVSIEINGNPANLIANAVAPFGTLYGIELTAPDLWKIRLWSKSFNPAGTQWSSLSSIIFSSEEIYVELMNPADLQPLNDFVVTLTVTSCNESEDITITFDGEL